MSQSVRRISLFGEVFFKIVDKWLTKELDNNTPTSQNVKFTFATLTKD